MLELQGLSGTIEGEVEGVISTLEPLTNQPVKEVEMAKESLPKPLKQCLTCAAPTPRGTVNRPRKYCSYPCSVIGHIKHGHSRSRIYNVWQAMIRRCHHPTDQGYKHYGRRGIFVCDRWRESFQAFYEDIGRHRPSPKHSLDRINNDGPYAPDNVRWATQSEQMNNRRGNVLVTHNGETHTVTQWAQLSGISRWTLAQRLQSGIAFEDAIRPTVPRRRLKPTLKEMGRWSQKYQACVKCAQTDRPYQAKGKCRTCYNSDYGKVRYAKG